MTNRGTRRPVAVYLEHGKRQVLACAVDWPGWCGNGTSERTALEALISCAPRYAMIARTADMPFPDVSGGGIPRPGGRILRPSGEITDPGDITDPHGGITDPDGGISAFQVTERLGGSASADRGTPGLVPACDALPVDAPTAQRCATLLTAAWAAFYRVSGGRSTSRLVDHVIDADVASARKLGICCRRPSIRDAAGIVSLREEITAIIGRPSDGRPSDGRPSHGRPAITKGWPTRYAARQITWHVIDHIWQAEDSMRPAAGLMTHCDVTGPLPDRLMRQYTKTPPDRPMR